jgi:hypothetical protein
MAAQNALFDPRAEANFIALTQRDSSVHIESYHVTVTVYAGNGRTVYLAFAPGSRTSTTTPAHANLLSCPVADMVVASAASATKIFTLPADHNFGREVKGLCVGNPHPVFRAHYTGGTPAATTVDAVIRLVINYSTSGDYPATGFQL